MSMSRSAFVIGFVCYASIVFGAGAATAAEKSSTAFAFYLNFLKTSAKAKSIGDIAPFMPSWWRSRYGSADAMTKAGAVRRARSFAQELKKIVLEKEEAAGGGRRLHMTARGKGNLPMRGKVLIKRESGKFKIEESRWMSSR